jgi:uncharacterized protein YjeT (DUF2065 family)
MTDFLAALGVLFAIEGLFLAAFPAGAKRTMKSVMEMSDIALRISGIIAALAGVFVVWLIRG